MIKRLNQEHPPLPKKKRVDAQGNNRRRFAAKSGNATLVLAKGLTDNACKALEDGLRASVAKLGGNIECNFVTF